MYRWEDKNGRVTYSDTPPPLDAKLKQEKKLGDNIIEQDRVPFALRAAQKTNPVTLYVTNCGEPCNAARELLAKRGIPYAEKNPAGDGAAGKKLTELAGGLEVPTMIVGDNVIKGFLEGAWTAALDSAGYPRTNANFKAAASARAEETPPPVAPPPPRPAPAKSAPSKNTAAK